MMFAAQTNIQNTDAMVPDYEANKKAQKAFKYDCRSTPARHAANLFHRQRHPSDQRET